MKTTSRDKVGILVKHLGRTQLANSIIENVNRFLSENGDTDIITFVENVVRPCQTPLFSVMNLNEAWEYNGIAIATNLSTAEKVLSFPGPKHRVFYVWDLEWMRRTDRNFLSYHNVYANPRLELIARSESHAKLIEQCWSRPVKAVVEDCDIGAMLQVITNGKNKN
jgi:hypothetical protein